MVGTSSCKRMCILLAMTAMLFGGNALAADDVAARIASVMNSPQTMQKATLAGKKAAFLCVHCHGEDGNSVQDTLPNLAGQNPLYLLNQIDKFGDGRRQDEFMTGLIKVLKPEDRFNMALYYSAQPVKSGRAVNSAQTAQGKKLYARACRGCHGEQAHGSETIARLAGQRVLYLRDALTKYRDAKGSRGTRSDPVMSNVAKGLSQADIEAVTAYLTTLP